MGLSCILNVFVWYNLHEYKYKLSNFLKHSIEGYGE